MPATEDGVSDRVSDRHGLVVEGDSEACIANWTKAEQGVIKSLDDVASMGEIFREVWYLMHGGDSGRMLLPGCCADKNGCTIVIDIDDGSVFRKIESCGS